MADHIKTNRKITKRILSNPDSNKDKKIRSCRHEPIVQTISKHTDSRESLLDVGAREGNLLALFRKEGFTDLFGIDISQEAIALLDKKEGLKGEVADAHDFDLGKEFSIVTISHALEHCPDPAKVLNCLHKHLKMNGILYIEVPRDAEDPSRTKVGHYYYFSSKEKFTSIFDDRWLLIDLDYNHGKKKGLIKAVLKKVK